MNLFSQRRSSLASAETCSQSRQQQQFAGTRDPSQIPNKKPDL
ncbi:hypothetical protein SYN63AY4M2_09320 [Synechococcus sp. 63AY4M2]|nr:hypothetical protein SYN63AY4M2_09320 [Synechococcus sp. 63AY4M2]